MDSELFHNRSLGSCLKDALDLYRTNFRTIFRRLWLPVLVMSLLLSSVMMIELSHPNMSSPSNLSISWGTSLFSFVLYIASIAVSIWIVSIIVSLLNGKSMKVNLPRIARLFLLLIGVAVVVCVLLGLGIYANYSSIKGPEQLKNANMKLLLSSALFTIVIIVAFLPLVFSSMKYCIEPDGKVASIFKRPYIVGFRHWGFLFLIVLLTELIAMVFNMFFYLPLCIIFLSYFLNDSGIAIGDPSGLPGALGILAFIIGTGSMFLSLFVRPWMLFSYYYAYGCIEEKEKARKKQKETKIPQVDNVDFEEVR